MKQTNIISQLFVLMAAILWGTTGSTQAFAPQEASPIVIGAIRMAVGGSSLFLIALIKGSYKTEVKLDMKSLLMSSICLALYQPLFFLGVSKTGIALGTVIGIGSSPIFSGIIEYFMGRKLNRKWIVGTIVSILGCILLFSGQGSINVNIIGIVLSMGAGLSYAAYVKVSQKLFQNSSIVAVNGLIFLISAIILSPILFMNNLNWVLSIRGVAVTVHLGLVTAALAYTLFAYGLVNISSPKAVTLTLAEPLTAAMLGIVVFNEKFTIISMIGISLLFCGLIINSFPDRKGIKY